MRGNGNKPCAQKYPAYACVQFDRLGAPPVFAPRRAVGVPPQCLLPRIKIEPELQMNLGAVSPGFWTLMFFANRVSDRDSVEGAGVGGGEGLDELPATNHIVGQDRSPRCLCELSAIRGAQSCDL